MSKKKNWKRLLCRDRYYYALDLATRTRYYVKSLECFDENQKKMLDNAEKKLLSASIDISKAIMSLEV
jgi:hypothetical protein